MSEPTQPTQAPIDKVWEEQGSPGRPIDHAGETTPTADMPASADEHQRRARPSRTEGETP